MTSPWRLVRQDSGATVVEALEIADAFWSRLRGLQFRSGLPAGAGLLLVPCPSVHTCCVRFPIDVVLLDRGGQVLAVRRAVRPWRCVFPVPGAYATLETAAGAAAVEVGDVLRVESNDGATAPPRSVKFLCRVEETG